MVYQQANESTCLTKIIQGDDEVVEVVVDNLQQKRPSSHIMFLAFVGAMFFVACNFLSYNIVVQSQQNLDFTNSILDNLEDFPIPTEDSCPVHLCSKCAWYCTNKRQSQCPKSCLDCKSSCKPSW